MTRRWSSSRGFDLKQLRIDWKPDAELPRAESSTVSDGTGEDSGQGTHSDGHCDTSNDAAVTTQAPVPKPVLRLRWDFRTHFPRPTPEAIDAGLISEEDAATENLPVIHQNHAQQMLSTLRQMDSGKGVSSDSEPGRLQRWYDNLLAVYQELFGAEAADAFDKAVRGWHARVEVTVDNPSVRRADTTPDSSQNGNDGTDSPEMDSTAKFIAANEPAQIKVSAPIVRRLPGRGEPRSVIARMPLPKPLAHAVAAGHFGVDEQGQPIYPSADEVHDITANHAELLIELLQSLPAPSEMPTAQTPAVEAEITGALTKYAEDFGEHAAQRLEAYARRQAKVRDAAPASSSRSR